MTTPEPRPQLPASAPASPDADGVVVAAVGTGVFAVLTVLCFLGRARLAAAGHPDWPAICACGVLLGLIGLAYCLNRRRRSGDLLDESRGF